MTIPFKQGLSVLYCLMKSTPTTAIKQEEVSVLSTKHIAIFFNAIPGTTKSQAKKRSFAGTAAACCMATSGVFSSTKNGVMDMLVALSSPFPLARAWSALDPAEGASPSVSPCAPNAASGGAAEADPTRAVGAEVTADVSGSTVGASGAFSPPPAGAGVTSVVVSGPAAGAGLAADAFFFPGLAADGCSGAAGLKIFS